MDFFIYKIKSIGNNYANALLISRASNLQICETMRVELEKSIGNCQKAHLKLNEYISHMKSHKLSKNLQSIVFAGGARDLSPPANSDQHPATSPSATTPIASKASTLNNNNKQKTSTKRDRKSSASTEREAAKNGSRSSGINGGGGCGSGTLRHTGTPRSESVSNFRLAHASMSALSGGVAGCGDNELINGIDSTSTLPNMKKASSMAYLGTCTICQDFIQNRLYLNKALMNSVEPYLESIKLQQMLTSLYEKIDLDKEILLVYTHIKREEPYLSSHEPLQPLFKRYSLGFERCIQIWRKKCSADSLLLCNSLDPVLVLPDQQLVFPDLNHKSGQQQQVKVKSTPAANSDQDHSIYSLSNQLNISSNTPSRGMMIESAF